MLAEYITEVIKLGGYVFLQTCVRQIIEKHGLNALCVDMPLVLKGTVTKEEGKHQTLGVYESVRAQESTPRAKLRHPWAE